MRTDRMPGRIASIAMLAGLFAAPLAAVAENPHAAQTQGAAITHHYPNVFARQGHTQPQIDAKIQAAYHQLFFGDAQTQRVYFEAGSNANGPLGYITDWANRDARTEGMSYGMMIAVQLNQKKVFDAIWNWAMTYMYIADPKHPSNGYFSWSCHTDGTPREETPAPDGEEYFAMALLFAANRWGDGEGIYNYRAQAEKLLHTMVHHPVMSGPTKFGPRSVGPEVDRAHGEILFVPGVMPKPFTDPSYHLPAFYQLFARWGPPEDRALWHRMAETSRSFFVAATNPQTGLAPDYANFDGTPHLSRFAQSGEFGYDAWRVASNWSVDWNWWHRAPSEQALSDRIQSFFVQQGIDAYGPVYTLAGQAMGATPGLTHEDHPVGLIGTNAVASLAAKDQSTAAKFVDALWQAPIPSGENRYYDGMLYLMSLLHCAGEFRVWGPVGEAAR